jgi:glutathione synthase/RimK-type ligase-like ATP-grasp enzyme
MMYNRFSDLIRHYHRLDAGDVFVGQVPSSHLKPVLLADLTARGVQLIPTPLAQLLNQSKTAQAMVLNPWMLPHTLAISRRKELVDALGLYQKQGIAVAVTKSEGLHCGHGVRRWPDLETLYSCVGLDKGAYPFVLQPFMGEFIDVRVILVGAFCEAYARRNPSNFRQNLSGGGDSRPYSLDTEQLEFCRTILERSHMPFAHIDVMIFTDNAIYLSEIRLNGGVKGALVTREALDRLKQEQLDLLAQRATGRVRT